MHTFKFVLTAGAAKSVVYASGKTVHDARKDLHATLKKCGWNDKLKSFKVADAKVAA